MVGAMAIDDQTAPLPPSLSEGLDDAPVAGDDLERRRRRAIDPEPASAAAEPFEATESPEVAVDVPEADQDPDAGWRAQDLDQWRPNADDAAALAQIGSPEPDTGPDSEPGDGLPVRREAGELATTDEEATAAPVPGHDSPDVRDIPVAEIAEIANIRPEYEEERLVELADSMRVQGQLEQVMVRPAPPGADHGLPFELVFGYRRRRAAERLGWTHLRCEVREIVDEEVLDAMISENLQRENLSPIAAARAMRAMIEITGASQAAVARRLGVDPSHVSHALQLLGLAEPVRELIDRGQITASHGETLAVLPAEQQERFAERVARDGVSVRKLEGWVKQAKEEEDFVPAAPPAPLEPVRPEDVTELPQLRLRADLDEDTMARLSAYVMLRNANDQEMLDWLEEQMSVPYERLWDWLRELNAAQTETLITQLLRRYVEAAHRFSSLEDSLRHDLGARPGEGFLTELPDVGTPLGASVDDDDDWDEDDLALPPATSEALPPASEG